MPTCLRVYIGPMPALPRLDIKKDRLMANLRALFALTISLQKRGKMSGKSASELWVDFYVFWLCLYVQLSQKNAP